MGSWFCDRPRLNFLAFAWCGVYMTAKRAVMLVKKVTYFGEFGYLNSSCIRKSIILLFLSTREINLRFCSKTNWHMFLLISGHHVGAHVDRHQHGVSIQISINLDKTFLRISWLRKIAVTGILARVFAYLPSFISQILDFIYWTVLIFISIYFEWRNTENQQYVSDFQLENVKRDHKLELTYLYACWIIHMRHHL